MMKSRLFWSVISMSFTEQWSTTGAFLERDTNIRGDHLIIHHIKNQNIWDLSGCWRVDSNISQTETKHQFEEQDLTTNRHGTMKLPDCFHKFLIDDIICRVLIYFIKHDKDDHQEEE